MILSDGEIQQALDSGQISIEPMDNPHEQIQPASVDLRLSNQFLSFQYKPSMIDLGTTDASQLMHKLTTDAFVLQPGGFALGTTVETVKLDDEHVARIEGRSSLGRLGLAVHATAGFIDPGFRGQITLEFCNMTHNWITLRSGLRICQLSIMKMRTYAERPYGYARSSKY